MSHELESAVEGLGTPRIAVVGDLMLDEYVWGDVERISPEAPIPVLRVSRREFRPGGAGSVVVNLARLGAKVSVFSLLGDDATGRQVIDVFDAEGVDTSGIYLDKSRPTTRKARHVGYVQQADRAVQQLLRVDEEDSSPISDAAIDDLLSRIESQADKLDAILISDYDKGLIGERLMRGLIDRLRERLPILIDPARVTDYSHYRGATLICPNRFEAELASGIGCRELAGCGEAARKLVDELDLECIAMTLDKEGILLCAKNEEPHYVPTKARVVADVTGAGDMVLSVLGLVWAAGGSREIAARLANVAGGIEVRHVGVTPISREELLRELRFAGHPAGEKIKDLGELQKAVERERAAGRKVVFTNGCFDLLHVGHHAVLEGASQEGDVLVVAINSDASVRALKGPTRPRLHEQVRARMLSSLEFVDYVTIFSEDTPNHLLEGLKPDVLVKGGEYDRDGGVVGRDIVEAYGGRVAFVAQVPGYSTTSLLGEGPAPE